MAESTTTRFSLARWTEETDTPNRVEFDSSFANIENWVAGWLEGLASARPAASAAYARFLYWARDTGELSMCVDTSGSGAFAWRNVANLSGTFPLLGGYKERRTELSGSGTITLDLAVANVFQITPSGAFTIALTNASTTTTFTPVTIRIMNSTHAVTWPPGTKFSTGAAPVLEGQTWISGIVDTAGVLHVGTAWTGVA